MTVLYLVRHGEVDHAGTIYGQTEVPLSRRGVAQLEAVAGVLGGVPMRAVYCSDLQRAAVGAKLIAEKHGLSPRPDPAFREMSLGVLEGLIRDEGLQRYPELAARRYRDMWSFRFPQGENLQDVADRVWPALERALAEHRGSTLALVSHNSVNRVILGRTLGLPLERVFDFDQDFGCLNRIDFVDDEAASEGHAGRARVRLLNWTPQAPL